MSKFATKAAANMFCQARYEAAKSNERLSSREGAAEEIGIDRTRLARIELGSTIPYQEEVLLMADCYKAPELKGNYCREMCPLGKNMPKIENAGLDRISLRMLSSFKKINEARDGKVIGLSSSAVYSSHYHKMISECTIDMEYAKECEEVIVKWGDYGKRIKDIRAVIAKFPLNDLVENKNYDISSCPYGFEE